MPGDSIAGLIDILNTSSRTSAKDDPAYLAINQLLRESLTKALQQIDGIIEDADIEYVHRFRVSIRKMRSMLSLFKALFPDELRRELNQQLKAIVKRTNQLRDLDVFLDEEDSFRADIPAAFEQGADALFVVCRRERSEAQKAFAEYLNSDVFKQDIANLVTGLDRLVAEGPFGKGHKPINKWVAKRLRKQVVKLADQCAEISHEVDDEAIHSIRIRFKKVRYLLDGFREVFERKSFKKMKKRLKGLQNHLGYYNDLSVQIEFLSQHLKAMETSFENNDSEFKLAALTGVSGIIGLLYEKKRMAKQQVIEDMQAFGEFTSFPELR